jgi:hypothetical protein
MVSALTGGGICLLMFGQLFLHLHDRSSHNRQYLNLPIDLDRFGLLQMLRSPQNLTIKHLLCNLNYVLRQVIPENPSYIWVFQKW